MDIVDRIFELADGKYQEQRDFAKDMNLTASIISEWRRGKSSSYYKCLPRLIYVLNTTAEYLLTGNRPVGQVGDMADGLSLNEEKLLVQYRILNQEGKEKALEYIQDLVATGRYKKYDKHLMGEKKA